MSFTVPDFRLPEFVAKLGRKLPQWPHSLSLCAGLNGALKLKWLPEEGVDIFEGKRFMVVVEDTGGEAHFRCLNGSFRPLFSSAGEADVCFRGTLSAFLKLMLRQEDPDTLFFNRQISIEGDTELGLAVKNLLDGIEWPPENLSRLLHTLQAPLQKLRTHRPA